MDDKTKKEVTRKTKTTKKDPSGPDVRESKVALKRVAPKRKGAAQNSGRSSSKKDGAVVMPPKGRLPLVALSGNVLFPNVVTSFFIENSHAFNALQNAVKNKGYLLMVAKRPGVSDLTHQDVEATIYQMGTLVEVLQFVMFPESAKIIVRGIRRVQISNVSSHKDMFLTAEYEDVPPPGSYSEAALAELRKATFELLSAYSSDVTLPKLGLTSNVVKSLLRLENPEFVVDNIVTQLNTNIESKQKVLEEPDLLRRIALVNSMLEIEISLVDVEKKLREEVKKQIEKNQKDYFLNEQLKAIHKELSGDSTGEETDQFREKVNNLKAPEEVKERLLQDIKKLSSMSSMAAEAGVLRGYLEVVTSLPWGIEPQIKIDLQKAQKLLDKEHYGLSKVKERIIEHLAVLHKSKHESLKGPILCLIGPPGVGKTSLASSIAKASGRKFGRISLGGLKDESEIRGHRKTYIGAMPGKIIQLMRKLKVNNPLILLDEVDKISSDLRGDPASALLEVLDPEQNNTFVDNYVEFEYDLSKVMFIATANSYNMHEALLDRMEVIDVTGYTEEEKVAISKNHLLPKNFKAASLQPRELKVDDKVIVKLIREYTRESGVRQLDREIANLTRKVVKDLVIGKKKTVHLTESNFRDYAGVPKFTSAQKEEQDRVGVVTGLAWTSTGGDTLYIESVKIPGKGDLKITGKLGEVMKESIQAAYSLIYSNCSDLNLTKDHFKDQDVHIHVPEGAIPKDGPSAGIAMVTAIVSLLTGKKVRSDIAMTGEITLRGKVLPIGGLKEKLLAALRFGIKEVLIPIGNEKDLIEVPAVVTDNVKITMVSNIYQVLQVALSEPLSFSDKVKPLLCGL